MPGNAGNAGNRGNAGNPESSGNAGDPGIGGFPGLLVNGRYRLVESIGQGGMGRVWRAVDEMLDRQVAVKEMRIDGLDPEDTRTRRERTLREGRATARIDHPHVVRVYDVVDEGERLWIVMELVAGRSLERVMAEEGPLSPRETARIGLGLVTALREVHARGVLHRDIKPGNVLVEGERSTGREGGTESGRGTADTGNTGGTESTGGTGSTGIGEGGGRRVVLTDFGIAAIQDATALTMVGMLVGSPDYMAPERISGRPQGPPSDVWSLGATLCAALAGHSPFFRDTTLATLHAVLYEEPLLPAAAGPLYDILTALLAKEPTARPTLTHLKSVLHPIAFPPPGPTVTATGEGGSAGMRSEAGSELPSPGPSAHPPPRSGVSLARSRAVTERGPAPHAHAAPVPYVAQDPAPRPTAQAGPPPVASPDVSTRRAGVPHGAELPGPAVPAAPGAVGRPARGDAGHRDGRAGRWTGRGTATAAAVGIVAVGTVLAIVLASAPGSHDGDNQAGGSSSGPAKVTGSSAGTGSSPSVSPTVAGTFRPPSLPPGTHQEAGGFAWATPKGWRRDVKTGAEVHYTSPDGTQELVAKSSLARGDLMETWRTSERNAQQGRDYNKIRLEETTFRGGPAVVWEYTFTLEGTPWHARLLGFDESGKSYQINTWYQPETEAAALKTYEKVKDSFVVR